MRKFLTALSLVGLSTFALAESTQVITQLKKVGIDKFELKSSPIKGVTTVVSNQGIFYITDDGKHLLDGKILEITDKGVVDTASSILLEKLNQYKKEMIVFPAKNEKYVVTVFMDITCHYCQKLHSQVKEYNDLGITLRYLAFPRRGTDSKTAREMEAIWTAADPQFALNEAEKGNLPTQLKEANIVKKHYQLGSEFGINGTPSLVTSKGELIPGYVPPAKLLELLQSE